MKNLYLIATAILLTFTYTYFKNSGSGLFLHMAENIEAPGITDTYLTDTIAINVKANPTGFITDTVTSHWNNRVAGVSGKKILSKLVWKSDGTMSSIIVSFHHGSSFTSANPCDSSSIAPVVVMKYGSIAAGTKDPSMGDPVLGGRTIDISGLDTASTYDVALLASKSDMNSTLTLTSQNQNSGVPVNDNCSGYAKLTSLIPDASGNLSINLHGPTPISNTIINGLYIIGHTKVIPDEQTNSSEEPGSSSSSQPISSSSFVAKSGWWTAKPAQQAYIYTPAGYEDQGNTQKYPLIIYLHDASQRGSSISNLLETGLPKELSEGQKMNAIVFCPQIDAAMPNWYSYITKSGYDWMLSHYRVDPSRVYITGVALGARGAWYMVRDYPQLIAAYAVSSGIYGLSLPADAAVADKIKNIPGYFVHGLLDVNQAASATGTIVNQLNSLSPATSFVPLARIVPDKGYESALWDNEFYHKATAKFNFEQFLLLHSKDSVYTATRYLEKLVIYIRQNKLERALEYLTKTSQLISKLESGTSKTNLQNQLNNAKTSLSGIYGRSFLLKCGATSVSGYVNNVADGSIGSMATNLMDQNGVKSSYTFNIVQQGSRTPEVATPGMSNQYFGLNPLIFNDGFGIEDNGALYTFSNLKNTKRYKIVLFSSRDYTPSNKLNFPEITAVVGDSAKYISCAYNTSNYIEFSGLLPVNGQISIRVKGGWTLASGVTPQYDSVSGAYIANIKDVQSYTKTGIGVVNAIRLVELGPLDLTNAGATTIQKPVPTADQVVPEYNDEFKLGTNLGFYSSAWSDEAIAGLVAKAKGNTIRVGMGDYFVEANNYNIRIDAFDTYTAKLDLKNLVCFIGEPSTAHKDTITYPGGTQSSKLFKNMYEPIWKADGTINKNNYFGFYVYRLVQTYGQYIKFWEVVNEPDYASGLPDNWLTRAPLPAELPNLQVPIYNYIHMMRIAWEVIKKYSPDSYVCPGGLGYYQFLDAMLRYTDNPVDGSKTATYPNTGGAYFDVVSYHVYPSYYLYAYNNKLQAFDFFYASDNAKDKFSDFKNNFDAVLNKYGYDGIKKPKKYFIVSETNVARRSSKYVYGSDEYQRNYIVKALVAAQKKNVISMNVFTTGDHDNQPAEDVVVTNEYNFMGLYLNLGACSPGGEQMSVEGIAWKTYGLLMEGFTYDPIRTAALNMSSDMDGAAFKKGDQYRYILWAKATGNKTEAGSATYSFPSAFNMISVKKYGWNYSTNNYASIISSQNIVLTTTPTFFEVSGAVASATTTTGTADLQLATATTISDAFKVQVAPNPSNNYFRVSVEANGVNERITLRVLDISGRIMEEKNYGPGSKAIQVGEHYPPGLYVIEVKAGDKVKQIKVIKQ